MGKLAGKASGAHQNEDGISSASTLDRGAVGS